MMATNDEIKGVLKMLAAAYPNYGLTPETVVIYASLLGDIPAGTLRAAALKAATSCKFFPSVYELREAAGQLIAEVQGVPSAFQAWDELLRAGNGWTSELSENTDPETRHNCPWVVTRRRFTFSHPLVKRVAEMLGWPNRFPDAETMMADRAHFLRAYESELRRASEQMVRLPELNSFVAQEKARLAAPAEELIDVSDALKHLVAARSLGR